MDKKSRLIIYGCMYVGKKKLVKCSLKRVQFESSIGCTDQVRARSYLRNNFDVWRLPATSDGDHEVRVAALVYYARYVCMEANLSYFSSRSQGVDLPCL